MSQKPVILKNRPTASPELSNALDDFILSRQALQCSDRTVKFYRFTLGKFLEWLAAKGISKPPEITPRVVREYIVGMSERDLKDTYIHSHARAIRTLLLFWHAEDYIPKVVKFEMPKVEKRRLPVLSADQVSEVLAVCNLRDKAVIFLMVDTGLRLSEVIALNWEDMEMNTGITHVRRGKGGKPRTVVIGATARRALLAYRKTLADASGAAPLIQTNLGTRFTGMGFRQLFRRLVERTGIHFSPHALRRTFTILSLRSGMDVLHLQSLLGHATIEMVQHYAQMVDDDLLDGHRAHSPIDNLARLRKKT